MRTSDFVCRKATAEDDVAAIAKYLHLTDPYIYPTVCKDPEDVAWKCLMEACLKQKDNIFDLDKISVVLADQRIVGVICVIPCGKRLHFLENVDVPPSLREGLRIADEGYFSPLIEESLSYRGYNITNVCVDKAFRGQGLGEALLRHGIALYGHGELHLDVIASNDPAIRLYRKCGFEIVSEYMGFSGDPQKLPCFHMVRHA